MAPVLGCIADDFTGATDLANTLVQGGLRTIQLIGIPDDGTALPQADAIVVALKSRTVPAAEATKASLAALRWLDRAGARQIFFKYCSTFDSTDQGNIGPVAEALMAALDVGFTIACPAFPRTGRTVYRGHLFVGDALLSKSGMRDHPLTPMTDANLVRVLQRQTRLRVGLVPYEAVDVGATAVRAAFETLRADGTRIAIVDALTDRHLISIGEALDGFRLVTGGSGVAMGLPGNFRRAGFVPDAATADTLPAVAGRAAVLSGSCSAMTLRQIETMQRHHPSFTIDPLALARGDDVVGQALGWAGPRLESGPVLISASAPPEAVRAVQARLGRGEAGALVERALARIAEGLVALGVRRLVVAGGETAGAVVGALGVRGLRIGQQIDPGVPCTVTIGDPPLALALKSGNFGDADFFLKALAAMP